MDWLHCNKCYQKPASNVRFSISNCKHIVCHKCIEQDKCSVCGIACKHLALTDNIADHEKMYFKKPSEICRKYLEHIAQVTRFQRKQAELLLSFHKHKISKMEAALQEAQCRIRLQEKETAALRSQVDEMKKLIAMATIPPNDLHLRRSNTPRPIAITSPSSRVTPRQTPQSVGPSSGNTATSSRPQSVGQMSESSLSRSGGLLTPRGSSIPSGRSTPRDTTMGSPSAGSGDSVSHRLASRTPTLLTIPVSRGQGSSERYRDAGDPPSHSVRHLPLADYTSPLRLIGLNDSHRAPSVTSEPRRPIQLVPTPRNTTFRQPSIPPSRNAVA
ncbi:E3 ubiquitin-protein ligase RNF212B-like [Chiloscyllium punctatum]|uniref:E3 ubiquitin-protein ligase RNF212B-like n=1 Tax=Chiloscyllium punctatum TaxID=137246 RepID=UPI003B6351F3